jgi:putative Holliday junction resolvase
VQQKETFDLPDLPETQKLPSAGRIVAIDPGTKHVGLAVSDPGRVIATPLDTLRRTSWKKLLSDIKAIIERYDAVALIVGLPLNTDGSESFMSSEARDMARKLALSLNLPVFLQDERVTSYEARKRLWDRGVSAADTKPLVDSEAASIILADFLENQR